MSKRILVVAPHGLDEVLGCGGVIAAASDAGAEISLLILCGDGTGRDEERRVGTHKAAEILGIGQITFFGGPENKTDTIPLGSLVGAVEGAVKAFSPDTVYAPHQGNLNIDHQNGFKAAATALRPVPGQPVTAFYAYEILSSTDWAAPGYVVPFVPTRYCDISGQLDRKLKALEVYGDEMRPEPHARSIEAVKRRALSLGATVGVEAAEAFVTVREIIRTA